MTTKIIEEFNQNNLSTKSTSGPSGQNYCKDQEVTEEFVETIVPENSKKYSGLFLNGFTKFHAYNIGLESTKSGRNAKKTSQEGKRVSIRKVKVIVDINDESSSRDLEYPSLASEQIMHFDDYHQDPLSILQGPNLNQRVPSEKKNEPYNQETRAETHSIDSKFLNYPILKGDIVVFLKFLKSEMQMDPYFKQIILDLVISKQKEYRVGEKYKIFISRSLSHIENRRIIEFKKFVYSSFFCCKCNKKILIFNKLKRRYRYPARILLLGYIKIQIDGHFHRDAVEIYKKVLSIKFVKLEKLFYMDESIEIN